MANSNLKVGVVGLGVMGRNYAQRLHRGEIPGAELAAVCVRDAGRRLELEREFPVRTFLSFDDFLRSGIDAVLVATPHFSHVNLGVAALEAGLHVLLDKPIAVDKAGAERLIAAHRERPRQVFAAMFNQRTNPAYARLRAMIAGGELGALQRIQWTVTDWFRPQHYYDSSRWRATWGGEGGGVLVNQCPHQLDLYQWLFGMPRGVRAFCQYGRFHDIEVEDSVTAHLEHADGATGLFVTTTGEAPGVNRLEVAGDAGLVVIADGRFTFKRNAVPTSDLVRSANESFPKPDFQESTFDASDPGEQHAGILRNFVAACSDGAQLIAPADEGIRSVELANAMLYSSATAQTITLPLDSAVYRRWLDEKIAGSRFRPAST
ncbi:putative oxidoreductase YdgJ [mine drainage metagenome]|uniref:Putative oxidoreductase YdgJ n=1 Tax=mine drainage metagenome TaxID=410659 RepID=A0A1J5SAQ5_9ZZZZ